MPFNRYGLTWQSNTDDLQVEMAMIRKGGKWKGSAGQEIGQGLSFHYERMRRILWPHLDGDHNGQRWHTLCKNELIQNKVTVLMGAASSGKTHEPSWLFLCEYYVFPMETCVLVSSTDLRGLELRVWGEIKSLHERALQKFDYLPGHLIDSKHAICTDDVEEGEARDLRRGLIGIPCIQNGKFIGLGKYCGIKQKRMRLIADECFPRGTMVDTPSGRRPIEAIRAGDTVIGANGTNRVAGTMKKMASGLVRIHAADGRDVVCTPNHPILTTDGWINAIDLHQGQYMVSPYESLQVLQSTDQQHFFLQQVLRREIRHKQSSPEENVLHAGARAKNKPLEVSNAQRSTGVGGTIEKATNRTKLHEESGHQKTSLSYSAKNRVEASDTWRQRNWPHRSRKESDALVPENLVELFGCDRHEARERISTELQTGLGIPEAEIRNRSRRRLPLLPVETGPRSEKGEMFVGSRVDRVEIIKQEDIVRYGGGGAGVEVYNLEVEGHPSYAVNGFVVHNCQFMGTSFLSAVANLDKNEDFKAAFLGNPNDILDPLGKAAEPLDGWSSHLEPTKTTVWNTRFMNGRCVNLIGTDSPNFDFPPEQPARFKYLISREKIANTLSFFAKDSIEYYGQCVGAMKIGLLSKRVLTRDLCRQFRAQEDVIWSGKPTTKVYFVDTSYGGDRCVAGAGEFGESVEGIIILSFHEPKIIPIRVGIGKEPEYQIAEFVKTDCESIGIPPANMGHDATGRGSLGTALAQVWSNQTNPVESGGLPTERPVHLDLLILDPKTKARRLKLCIEHYDRRVTEFWFAVRYAVEAAQIRNLPDEPMEELCTRKWEMVKGNKRAVEVKDGTPAKPGMKQRTGKSPDMGDWAAGIVEMARRRGFVISKLGGNDENSENDQWQWFRDQQNRQQDLRRKHSLSFRQ